MCEPETSSRDETKGKRSNVRRSSENLYELHLQDLENAFAAELVDFNRLSDR